MKQFHLKRKEIVYLDAFASKGSRKAREIRRARILLLSNKGKKDKEIQDVLHVGRSTIWRTKRSYNNKGIEYALTERQRPGQPPKYKQKEQVEIIACACTSPPAGRKRWTIRLLAEELCKKKGMKTINRESIRLVLKKAKQNPG